MCAFPTTAVPTVPESNCCMRQVHKKLKGKRTVTWVTSYKCPTGNTQRGKLTLEGELYTYSAPCDQDPALIPDGSKLRATGPVIRREDGLADFSARFTITAPSGTVLFRGAIQLLDRVGTHHPPHGPEVCNPEKHIEGWLAGTNKVPAESDLCLHLQFVATGSLPDKAGSADLTDGVLNGVCLRNV